MNLGKAGQHCLSHYKVRPASKSCLGSSTRVAFVSQHHLFPSVGCHFAAAMQEKRSQGIKGIPGWQGQGKHSSWSSGLEQQGHIDGERGHV